MNDFQEKSSWLDRSIFTFLPFLNWEFLVFCGIVLLTIISRLYDLGARVFSHDENLHLYFSWLFSIGKGYQHTPLMHGPLLFHLTALTFLLFGASDFTARLPQALASILTIVMLWKWRRYLGRAGTLVTAGLALVSPIILYYGRYARNEAFIGLFFVLMLYAILRYLETGKQRYLLLLTLATVLHFTSKETAFIYVAQALLFLAVYLINRVTRVRWKNPKILNGFLISISIGVLTIGAALGLTIFNRIQVKTDASQTAAPIIPGQIPWSPSTFLTHLSSLPVLIIIAGCAFLLAAILLILGYGWNNLCRERSFDMLVLLGTFTLPQLTAFPVSAFGWDPLEYQFKWPGWNISALWAQPPVRTAVVFLILTILSIVIGLLWDKNRWFIYAVIFWSIYITFYTSIFSNWQGFFTGTVGSLGYWLQQQGVHRGDQPWYYYILIQMPIYEFLPALGIWLAAYFGLRQRTPAPPSDAINATIRAPIPSKNDNDDGYAHPIIKEILHEGEGNYTFPLLFWWSLSSLLAYTLAGEKMPWLTFHITLPMILITGWGLGQVIERVNLTNFRKQHGLMVVALLVILFCSLACVLVKLFGANPPFRGKTLAQLTDTGAFLLSGAIFSSTAIGLYYLCTRWSLRDFQRTAILVVFTLLLVLTIRTSIRAVFVNADNASEYLVYAHGATGIQDVMDQITRISSRTVGEKNLQVAYDGNLPNQGVSWSFKWYLRDYPNAISFNKPDDSLRNVPVIIVDQQNFGNIKPIVGDNYYRLDYIRMVWPNQDYFTLNWQRIKNALSNPALRDAIFQIWLNRNYTEYAKVTGESGFTLSDWQPSARMQLFIRKDIAEQIWEYGILKTVAVQSDPYAKGFTNLSSDLVVGSGGNSNGQFNAPRGLTIAPDGSLYVADSRNNRLEHLDSSGNFIRAIGQTSPGCPYATTPPANVPIGTFCEPWGVAISPDAQSIYVADTWNHRIQKLKVDGTPVKAWGTPNYDPVSSGPFGLWGPRGIIVDSQGHVLVADTGNKRVLIYDAEGNFIFQMGSAGANLGQFDEPVGLALDAQGNLYVADTWNQRVQVFTPNTDKTVYKALSEWDVAGWSSQSLDNKPYLAVDQQGHIFACDPDSFRLLEFSNSGVFLQAWGGFGTSSANFGMPSGIAVDSQGRIWVSDAGNNRLMRFTLP